MSPIPTEPRQLVIVPNVGLAIDGERVFLDIKAAEGLHLYAKLWPGPLLCIGRRADVGSFGYGAWFDRAALPFEVACVSEAAGADDIAPLCSDAALVLGGGDSHLDLDLVEALAPRPVVLIIEYTLRTRLDILRYDRRGLIGKLKTALWLLKTEPKRRRSLAEAAGLQANGTPAFNVYGPHNKAPLLYFDTRLDESMFIGLEGAATKAAAVLTGQPLRMAFSGRLETMKGAHYLVPVMAALRAQGVGDATLDIYGDGSLSGEIEKAAVAAGLSDAIRIHGPVPFESELVPRFKTSVDLFLCCHPQADPSCTYLETLGCGVPIAGFRNQAFEGILALGECGVGVPIGHVKELAAAIAALDADRQRLAELTRGAAAVATDNLFEKEFAMRVAHLRHVAFGTD